MKWLKTILFIKTSGKGFYNFTDAINAQLSQWEIEEGMAFLFVQHTSASLVINENYAPSAQTDMENFLAHIAPKESPGMLTLWKARMIPLPTYAL